MLTGDERCIKIGASVIETVTLRVEFWIRREAKYFNHVNAIVIGNTDSID
jgi:hypothetical protein